MESFARPEAIESKTARQEGQQCTFNMPQWKWRTTVLQHFEHIAGLIKYLQEVEPFFKHFVSRSVTRPIMSYYAHSIGHMEMHIKICISP
jgi:hypothetical protein